MDRNKKKQNINKYADKMLDNITDCLKLQISKEDKIQSGIVDSVNNDGTINIRFPLDEKIFTHITNQTPFVLKNGDSVEIMLKRGSYSNCWIIAKHGLIPDDIYSKTEQVIINNNNNGGSSEGAIQQINLNDEELANVNGVVNIPLATNDHAGAISAEDKRKINDIAQKANLNSPTFTGVPKVPTPSTDDNSTQIANTAFVQTKVNEIRTGSRIVVSETEPLDLQEGDFWYKII